MCSSSRESRISQARSARLFEGFIRTPAHCAHSVAGLMVIVSGHARAPNMLCVSVSGLALLCYFGSSRMRRFRHLMVRQKTHARSYLGIGPGWATGSNLGERAGDKPLVYSEPPLFDVTLNGAGATLITERSAAS